MRDQWREKLDHLNETPIFTPENMAKLTTLADTPFTEQVIPRVGPPRCLCCGEFVGKCDHGKDVI